MRDRTFRPGLTGFLRLSRLSLLILLMGLVGTACSTAVLTGCGLRMVSTEVTDERVGAHEARPVPFSDIAPPERFADPTLELDVGVVRSDGPGEASAVHEKAGEQAREQSLDVGEQDRGAAVGVPDQGDVPAE